MMLQLNRERTQHMRPQNAAVREIAVGKSLPCQGLRYLAAETSSRIWREAQVRFETTMVLPGAGDWRMRLGFALPGGG